MPHRAAPAKNHTNFNSNKPDQSKAPRVTARFPKPVTRPGAANRTYGGFDHRSGALLFLNAHFDPAIPVSVPLRPPRPELRYAWLGDVYVDVTANQLHDHGREIRLTPKAMAVLRELMLRQNVVVRRDDLLGLVWRDGFPTDDVLTHAIKELRRALGDDPRAPELIETIPRVGYRLRASVRVVPDPPNHEVPPSAFTAANEVPETPLGAEAGESADAMHTALAAVAASDGARAAARTRSAVTPVLPELAKKPPRLALVVVALLAIAACVVLAFLLGRRDAGAPALTATAPAATLEPIALTSDVGSEYFSSPSPDAGAVVYVRASEGSIDSSLMLKSRDPGAQAVTLVPAAPNINILQPAWSPDGTRIVYSELSPDQCLLRTVPSSGGMPQTIAACDTAAIDNADWSPDGTRLYTSKLDSTPQGGRRIAMLSVASGEFTPLDYSPHDDNDVDLGAKVSPDGKWIAFRRGTAPYADLWLMGSEGGTARPLAEFGARLRGYSWLPDGKSLIVSSDHAGAQSLYRVRVSDGRVTPLGVHNAHFPNVARREPFLSFHQELELAQLVSYRLENGRMSGAGELVAPASRPDFSPSLSPSGKRVIFISERSGTARVWLHEFDSGQTSAMSADDRAMPEFPQWAPDENGILYVSRSQSGSRLVRVDLASRRRTEITPPDERVRFGSYSSDGEWILYSSDRDGTWQVWRMRPDGSAAEKLTTAGGIDPRTFPGIDGIFYSKHAARGLFRLDLATREETRISNYVGYFSLGAYSVFGDTLWAYQRDNDRGVGRVLERPLAGGVEADTAAREVMLVQYPGGKPWEVVSFDHNRSRMIANMVMRDSTDVFILPLAVE